MSFLVVNCSQHLDCFHSIHLHQRHGDMPILQTLHIGVAIALRDITRSRYRCCHESNRQCPRDHDVPVPRAVKQCVLEQCRREFGSDDRTQPLGLSLRIFRDLPFLKKLPQHVGESVSILTRGIEICIFALETTE